MTSMTRRSVIRSAGVLAAGASLARPYIANAAAKTAVVWWTQGFAQQEDIAFKQIVSDYEKASGNIIDYSIIPYAPIRQKIVSALTSGDVPDLFQNTPAESLALQAWNDQLVDLTDVVETQKGHYAEAAALQFANTYNGVEKRRAYYGVPYSVAGLVNHIWRPLVEKAGFKIGDAPKTWDAYYDFFKGMQKPLRASMRNVYGVGFTLSTTGNDSNNQFNYFLSSPTAAGIWSRRTASCTSTTLRSAKGSSRLSPIRPPRTRKASCRRARSTGTIPTTTTPSIPSRS